MPMTWMSRECLAPGTPGILSSRCSWSELGLQFLRLCPTQSENDRGSMNRIDLPIDDEPIQFMLDLRPSKLTVCPHSCFITKQRGWLLSLMVQSHSAPKLLAAYGPVYFYWTSCCFCAALRLLISALLSILLWLIFAWYLPLTNSACLEASKTSPLRYSPDIQWPSQIHHGADDRISLAQCPTSAAASKRTAGCSRGCWPHRTEGDAGAGDSDSLKQSKP